MDKFKDFITELLFPKFCFGCKKEGAFLCQGCRHLLDILEFDYKRPGKNLNGLYFAASFKNPVIKTLIHNFKYKPYTKNLAETLASLLIEHFVLAKTNTDSIWENSVLIPVPLHEKKLRQRGYNQSEELAKELAKILKIPVISNFLVKIKSTESQMHLKKEAREKNLLGAFAIKKPFDFAQGKIFLVDDVYTTGSTMEECAKVLRKAGAKTVWGIAVAREE